MGKRAEGMGARCVKSRVFERDSDTETIRGGVNISIIAIMGKDLMILSEWESKDEVKSSVHNSNSRVEVK